MIVSVITFAAAMASASPEDLQNVSLSKAIVQRVGDRLWPGWSATRFAIDLLTQDGPVLIDAAQPFTPPKFPRDLEATLILEGTPFIVIGEPKFMQAASPVRWSVTLLHEHFHQWQYSWPAYDASVKALGLARGSQDAMWMLNYAFPYDDVRVDAAYGDLSRALADALEAMQTTGFAGALQRYKTARASFKEILRPEDYRYFAFQCWQEGTARYTEMEIAELAAGEHERDPRFLSDAQAAALEQDAARTYAGVLKRLRTIPLREDKRIDFYAVGAGEALLLDRIAPAWHGRYLNPGMDLSAFF